MRSRRYGAVTLFVSSTRPSPARGHWQLVGTAETIANEFEERFNKGGADGFNIMPPTVRGGLDNFIELVIPELRRRGLFCTEYEGCTLRENLGLPIDWFTKRGSQRCLARNGRWTAE